MTHINAFYAAVDEAQAEVHAAQGKLAAAKESLLAKQKEEGVVVEEPTETEPAKKK